MTALETSHVKASPLDHVLDAIAQLGPRQDIEWEIKKLRDYRGGLLSLSPLRVGDRAVLIDPPTIERSSGWWHCRHFIVASAICTIAKVDWRVPHDEPDPANGFFIVDVIFDDESHLSEYDEDNKRLPDGETREVPYESDRRHTFAMAARRFKKVA